MAKKSTAIDVTQGVIWQQLLSLCVPIFFSSFFQQAYTLIGTYIVGQFGGKLALGGIQPRWCSPSSALALRWRRRRLRGHYRSVFWPAR
ncbi:MAG: hypothetical protein ACLU37_02885 [Collinsella sp.]